MWYIDIRTANHETIRSLQIPFNGPASLRELWQRHPEIRKAWISAENPDYIAQHFSPISE